MAGLQGSFRRVLFLGALAFGWPIGCSDGDDPHGGSGGGAQGGGSSGGRTGGTSNGGTSTGGRGGSVSSGGATAGGAAGGPVTQGGDGGVGGNGGAVSAGAGGESGGRSSGGAAGDAGSGGSSGGAAGGGGAGSGGSSIVLVPPAVVCPTPRDGAGAGGEAGSAGAGAGGAKGGGDSWFPTEGPPAWAAVTELGRDVMPIAINERGQVVAVVERSMNEVRACRSFIIDELGVREILAGDGEPCTLVHDINGAGLVVGTLGDPRAVGEPPATFLWQDGSVTLLSEVSGMPVAINDSNQVVFDSGQLWDSGQVIELTAPDGAPLRPTAMNTVGQIVGDTPGGPAFLWQDGDAVELPLASALAINELGHVLGTDAAGDFWLWDGTDLLPYTSLTGLAGVGLRALNNRDEAVGTLDFDPGDFPPLPIVATFSQFRVLPGEAGEAYDQNNRGEVIGRRFRARRGPGLDNLILTLQGGVIWSRRFTCTLACCP